MLHPGCPRVVAASVLAATGWGCSGDTSYLERPGPPLAATVPGAFENPDGLRVCLESGDSHAVTHVLTRQAHVDALEGCELIDGSLEIASTDGTDLRALASLREVRGRLTLGDPYTGGSPGFTSLEGLEGLRRLQGLTLAGVEAADLRPLASVEQLDTPARAHADDLRASLEVRGATSLVDLHGLENVRGLFSVAVYDSPSFRSLDGVRFDEDAERLPDVYLVNCPVVDFDLVSTRTELGKLQLSAMPLQSLTAVLGSIRRLRMLSLSQNRELTNASALAQLEYLEALEVMDNPLLAELPEMPLVSELSRARISGNLTLVQATRLPRLSRLSALEVGDNPLLETLDGFAALEELANGDISGNPLLATLDLHSLGRVSGTLRVTNNPQLDPSALAAVQGRLKITGNRGDPTELSPCPWADDDECDEPPDSNACAVGTDPICAE
jgi:hypothetical protein